MSLKVVVHSALNLPDVDFKGHSDPFAVLSFRGRKKKTTEQKDTLRPTWQPNEATFEWPLGSAHLTDNEKLLVKVKDYEKVWFKRLLGQVEIPLREVRRTKKVEKRAYELQDGKQRPILDATITLEIEYVPPGDTTADVKVSQKQEETRETPEGKRDDDHEDYRDEYESDNGDDASRKGKEKQSRVPEKKRIRRRLRRKWSDKIKDFQIQIQILEGRHLPGSDIHPLVRVTVAGQRQHTNTAHSTNRPTYNKMLHFNFHGTSEAELFDDPIILEVFNSRGTFRFNSLLGFFKFDIGYVYERKGHSFINKWIMMSKPDGKDDDKFAVAQKTTSARSPAGYLKVSAVVLGPGDKLPVGVDATSQHDKDEDIDANCLVPVGVQRQSALFVLKVYQAKDIPQMDTGVVMKFKSFFARLASWSEDKEEGVKGKDRATQDLQEEKNLVDPYLTFSFGGKEVSTDVIYNKSEPEFREVLRIPFMSPSMCERLKLQLMDWDQGSRHDHIGTAFLSLSSISGPGEVDGGFLPQFGPCFINFYGSPREYHQMLDKYDYLNKGIGEGVAYRGRLLVELKTMPTHSGVTRPDRISWAKQDTISFESFKRLSSFTLFACFHEANMVAVTDRPVEFELSIGNKGTKFDESVAHSNTPPCKAIPDGFHYHFLPWSREKPCVWIESQWEDIAFRIEPFNVLNRMRENLENELEELKVSKEDQNGLDHMHAVFKGFIKTCSDHLKYFQDIVPTLSGLRNSLDNEIQNLRINELNCLIEDAKAFYNKPESETKKENVTMEIRNYIRRIKSMAMEPQLSIPDVILWMISGDKRVAYYRIPAHDLLFSNNVDAYGNSEISQGCGKFCGKIIELPLKYPRREGADDHLEIPALVRMELWLGLRRHQQQWINRGGDYGEFRVYAETYENQKRKSKTEWKPADSPSWPNYSDAAGQLKLPKESFAKPDGWQFSGDWNESAMTPLRQPDENLSEFLDEMYEHERRKFPGGDWEPGKPIYTDTYGDETTLSTDPTTGWTIAEPGAVNGGWTVDLNRAVDEEGWEYSPHRTYVDFGPEEKAFHLSRRRRLIRKRIRKPGEQVQKDAPPTDGWEYSRSLHESFHSEEKSTDCLRRRRLLHQIVPSAERTKEGAIKFPIFKILVQGKKGKQSALCVLPRMFVTYKCAMKCQLWVSIYQARGLICQDNTGKNDPYVRVTFVNKCQQTKILPQTICPTWDQTLIFEDVDIYGNPGDLAKYPPNVVMELFDHDKGKHDYLGRCMIKPKVLLRENGLPKRKLLWRKVRRGEQDGGQILVECELFLIEVVNLPALPEKREDVYPIRHELRPVTQKKAIEILNWGVRDLKGNKSLMIPTPSVEFECNQEIIKSGEVIGDMKTCPNFRFPVLKRTILELPENDEYAPPLNILVYDNNWFGKSLLGICEIPSLKTFEVQPVSQSVVDDQLPDADPKKGKETDGKRKGGDKTLEDKEVFDWWSKYHASKDEKAKDRTSSSVDGRATTHTDKYLYREYDMLTIYPDKLENQPEFQGFNDFITTFPLRRGKTKTTKDGDAVVGKFKGAFRVINNPDEDDPVPSMAKMRLPSNNPVNCIVRVYIVRATQLQPKDADGLSDPYVIASLGERTRGQPSEHIAKTLNPIFGRVFEFKAKIPLVKDLKIQVWDYDFPTPDDLIGETEIDLEQRLLSRYHATCGLPKTYFKSGPFEWRDTLTPFQLLAKYCALTGKELTLDKGKPEVIIIDETPEFPDNETPLNPETGDPLQRLALRLLHTKFGFVPEHVETRPLYSRERPDMEQGKLEMWVDIFTEEDEELAKLDPSSIGADRTDGMQLFTIVKGLLSSEEEKQKEEEGELPVDQVKKYPVDQLVKAPIFIDPRQPIKYELRVIIWNTTDVLLDDKTITGEKMSDIFVKAWIEGSTGKKQFTSVHERSLDGNGSFNWRMVFPLEYLSIEKEIVVREKVHRFGRDVKVDTVPPVLKVQIFDKDRFTGSDFIGDRHLNLSRLDRPCVHPNHCGTSKDPSKHNQYIDLFKTERKTGWWACYNKTDITGKVEMTLEILDEEDAKANPVGLGQSEPNQNPTLPKPVRPAHSFLWYAHPLKTFRYIIWRNYKGFFIKVLVFCLLVLLIAFFVYNIPGYAAKRMVGA